jgi:hypothetical protein
MDFWDLTKLIFRRWPISLPILLLSIAATLFTAKSVKPDYVMTSYVQLVPPYSVGTAESPNAALRNPWNSLGLSTLGQAAIYATQDQKFVDQLKSQRHTTNFSLTLGYPDPIITVQVVGRTPSDAVATTGLVLGKLETTARTLQKQYGAQDPTLIQTQRLDQGENVTVSGGKVKRAIVAVAGVGLMLMAGLTILFDVLMRRRARRRAGASGTEPQAGTASAKASANGKTMKGTNAESTVAITARPAQRAEPPAESSPYYTGTYRSTSSPDSDDEPRTGVSEEPDSPHSVPSDMTIVLKPEWLSGEKRR